MIVEARLTPIAQSDDGQASFSAIANTTYMIVVDGLGGAAGDIILSLAPMLRGNTTLREDIITFVNTH